MLTPMNDFTQKFSNIAGDYISKDTTNIKDMLDSQPREIRDYIINTLIPQIESDFALKVDLDNLVLGQIPNGSLTDDKLSNSTGMVKAQLVDINSKLNNYNSYASAVDSNGIYTVMDYKRSDGTLYMKSTLSGGTSPNYTTDTWQFYDAAGITVVLTKIWTISYDANGKITSKVVA